MLVITFLNIDHLWSAQIYDRDVPFILLRTVRWWSSLVKEIWSGFIFNCLNLSQANVPTVATSRLKSSSNLQTPSWLRIPSRFRRLNGWAHKALSFETTPFSYIQELISSLSNSIPAMRSGRGSQTAGLGTIASSSLVTLVILIPPNLGKAWSMWTAFALSLESDCTDARLHSSAYLWLIRLILRGSLLMSCNKNRTLISWRHMNPNVDGWQLNW